MAIASSGTPASQKQLHLSTAINTFSVDAGTSPTLLTVWVFVRGSTTTVSSITYNGVSCTFVDGVNSTSLRAELWYLESPANGSNTLTVTMSASGAFYTTAHAGAWSGTETTSSLDDKNTSSGNSTTPSVSVTPTTDNQLVTGGVIHEDANLLTAGSGFTTILNVDDGNWVNLTEYLVQTTAAAQTVDASAGAAAIWAMVAATFKEAAGSGVDKSATDSGMLTTTSDLAADDSSTDSGALTAVTDIAATIPASDSATLTTTGSLVADNSGADSATLTETGSPAIATSVTDSGALTATSDIAAGLSSFDNATLTEVSSLDTGGGVAVSGTDAGTLTETAVVFIFASDSAALSESVAIAADVSGVDTGAVTDTASVTAVLTGNDSAIFADSGLLAVGVTGVDSAALSESGGLTISSSESFSFSEATVISAVLSSSDAAAFSDTGDLNTGTIGYVLADGVIVPTVSAGVTAPAQSSDAIKVPEISGAVMAPAQNSDAVFMPSST